MEKPVHVSIDIGTTNITLLALDLKERRVDSYSSVPNQRVQTGESFAYIQDPLEIEKSVRSLLSSIHRPIASICVTGQVHGILYYKADGEAVSPLYTWLDQRGMVPVGSMNSQEALYDETGVLLPAGYGLLTHYANRGLHSVPSEAIGFCGILEYITGRLVGKILTESDPSCLGPYGAFDPVSLQFDRTVLKAVFGDGRETFLDAARPFSIAGHTAEGIPVAYAVGDNQAGFFGMVSDWNRSALISIGTSGQVSLFSKSNCCPGSMELRPFLGEGYLHVGATLAAGKAYETVKQFLISVLRSAGNPADDEQVFALMKEAASKETSQERLMVDTRFAGTRQNPTLRGSIHNIGLDNFTLGNLVRGTVEGIIEELYSFSREAGAIFASVEQIVATGSSVRKNVLFSAALNQRFGMPTVIAEIEDGAGFGAALIGAVATGALSVEDVKTIVHDMLGT
ncbi:MAG TPA: FGGY-family carbohydrate kinase [Spirochaetales bacterium]|nr:FGGY-family carbohydrate kinase [Spirochaetales bacterium]